MVNHQNKTIELFTNETTEGREQLTKIINFNGFQNLQWAELKVQLHANNGFEAGFLPTQWKLIKFVINGITFYPSDKLNSTNKVHDSKGSEFFKKVLKVNDVNTISIHWTAPFGAGVTSPHAAITAVLSVIGDSVPFAEDLQFNSKNVEDSISRFTKNQSLPSVLIIIAIIIVLALVAIITIKAASAASSAKSTTSNINTTIKEVKGVI